MLGVTFMRSWSKKGRFAHVPLNFFFVILLGEVKLYDICITDSVGLTSNTINFLTNLFWNLSCHECICLKIYRNIHFWCLDKKCTNILIYKAYSCKDDKKALSVHIIVTDYLPKLLSEQRTTKLHNNLWR